MDNAIFLKAVNALDAGNLSELQDLIGQYPSLVKERMMTANDHGYFKDPYLIWFVADNPIRNKKLPDNVLDILHFLIDAVKSNAPAMADQQLNYTLGLIATGFTPRESGFQVAMMDALIDVGAKPGNGMGAITNGNLEAARHLIDLSGELTLTSALILNREEEIESLFERANDNEKLTALTAAAFYGREDRVKYLLDKGVDPNGFPSHDSGFHAHATALHQAVSSASLNTVKLLVEAGAKLNVKDKIYDGTPLDWADYLQRDANDERQKAAYAGIESYLRSINGQ